MFLKKTTFQWIKEIHASQILSINLPLINYSAFLKNFKLCQIKSLN